MAQFRLLAIDGGGIRGLIPGLVLAHIEQQTRKPIHELFDVVAGTSTGGILALGLTKPGPNLEHRARDLCALYEQNASTIFAEGPLRRALYGALDHAPVVGNLEHRFGLPRHAMLRDLLHPKYPASGRREVLEEFFGDTPLSAAKTRVLVTSYDTELRVPVLFVSRAADAAQASSYVAVCEPITMLDAAMATSAAPTYFPPHEIKFDTKREFSLVDGGMFSNNPTGLAHAFLKADPDPTGDVVVSLGTGSMTDPFTFEMIDNWGALQWGPPALKMMFDGQSAAVALILERRFAKANYFRIQADLSGELPPPTVSDDLDDASTANIDAMKLFAGRLIEKHANQLDRICALLSAPR